jgi:tripartite ATP-independent transporter DctM subunit
MNALGYDKKISTGTVAAGGTLGILIPPSIILVFYGTITETSVGACLIAGILPGILSVFLFMLALIWLARWNPSLVPAPERYTWKERFDSLKGFWGIGVLFGIVMGGIYGGVATVSETAALGAVAAFIMLVINNKGRISALKEKLLEALRETLLTCAMIFLVLIGSYVYSFFITLCGVPAAINEWVARLSVPGPIIVILFLLFLVVLGCFLDPFSILVISLPVMHPVVVHTLGYSSIWFSVICTILIEIGCITPPVGLNVYVIAGIAPDVPMEDIFTGALWFLIPQTVVVTILMIFPIIVTWLPSTMGMK